MSSIAALVRDAPPGETDALKRDIEVFSGNNSSVQRKLEQELQKANVDQLTVVEVKGKLTVLSKYNQIDETTFFTHGPNSSRFTVNHNTRKTTVEGKYEADEHGEPIAQLQKAIDKYVAQHYAGESVAAVFPYESKTAIVIIGRKLSPQNFHNGQITAEYVLDSDQLRGKILADVHYFEEGNVRLKASKIVNTEVASASEVGGVLARLESEFETNLNKTLVNLNEREFKALRRQLPVTRQPMMWGKAVAGYKLGKELENR